MQQSKEFQKIIFHCRCSNILSSTIKEILPDQADYLDKLNILTNTIHCLTKHFIENDFPHIKKEKLGIIARLKACTFEINKLLNAQPRQYMEECITAPMQMLLLSA